MPMVFVDYSTLGISFDVSHPQLHTSDRNSITWKKDGKCKLRQLISRRPSCTHEVSNMNELQVVHLNLAHFDQDLLLLCLYSASIRYK